MSGIDWPQLEGRTVLLIEDESLVSLLAEDILCEAGCSVLLAMRLEDGVGLASSASVDLAILDVNLGNGDTSFPIARILRSREIPFIFATGYGALGLEDEFTGHFVVQKPYSPDELLVAASGVLQEGNGERSCKSSEVAG